MGKWKEHLQRTRAFLTNDSEGAVLEGLGLGFTDDYEQAIECFDQALYGILGTTERSLNAYFYKACALSELDRHGEAIDVYKKYLKHKKDDASAWNNLGYEYFEIENYNEAKKCFEHAIKLDPEEPIFLSSKAEILFELKENKKAIDVVDKALKLDSNYTDALFLKCDILIEMNRSEEVIKILNDLEYDEDIVTDVKELESIAYHELSNYNKALECVNEALKFEPNDETFWYNKACYLSLLDRQEEANDALLIATSIEPENINEIENDEDFKNVKNTERFQKLLNQSVLRL
ncbi:MAG: tetratricopeptide repeat protein [Nitrosopumilus sp.]|nr:tetratricopeptide repeat protein [Nitrosopumilus sp.]